MQLLLATCDYVGALDVITTTKDVLRDELTGVTCVRYGRALTIRSVVASLMYCRCAAPTHPFPKQTNKQTTTQKLQAHNHLAHNHRPASQPTALALQLPSIRGGMPQS